MDLLEKFKNFSKKGKLAVLFATAGVVGLTSYCGIRGHKKDSETKETKLYLVDMKAKNSGKILNVASIAGFMPGPLMATYYSTKAYVVRLSESIREELRKEKSKVQISILCPGPVNTNFNNVANVKFHMREANSYNVAKFAIDKLLKGKFYIIPGLDVKVGIFFSHFVPSSFVAKITYMVQKRKLEK